jgi:hypothetical protein
MAFTPEPLTKPILKTPRELRTFALIMTGALGLLGVLLLWRGRSAWPYLLGLAALFLILGLAAPTLLRPVERLWMKLAHVLGIVMTFVILTLTFYLVLTPLGLLLRLLGKRPLDLPFEPDRSSYWVPIDPDGPATRPDRPY